MSYATINVTFYFIKKHILPRSLVYRTYFIKYQLSIVKWLSDWRIVNALASHRYDPDLIPGVGM